MGLVVTLTLSTTSGRVDVITLTTTNNGLSWLGFVGGLDLSMSPIGLAKGIIYSSGTGGGSSIGPPDWQFADAASFGTPATGAVLDILIASNVDSYRQTAGSLLGGLTLVVTNNQLRLQGTLSQFGFAVIQVMRAITLPYVHQNLVSRDRLNLN